MKKENCCSPERSPENFVCGHPRSTGHIDRAPSKNISAALREVQEYWDRYAVALRIPGQPWGSEEFFRQIKADHDPAYALSNRLLDLPHLQGKEVLEVGCGIGLDVVEYVRHGARVTAIDLSPRSAQLARRYLDQSGLRAAVEVANVEELPFPGESFDVVVARGILMYTPDAQRAVGEIRRVLKPKGKVLAILHNRYSWFALLAKASGTNRYSQMADPPINVLHTPRQARQMFADFGQVKLAYDKYPLATRRRSGAFAVLYNRLFVPSIQMLPRAIIRPWGYYIILQAVKLDGLGDPAEPSR
jgi:SAM-dependent methyltransferase